MPQGLAGSRPPAPTILKPTFSGASVWAAYSAIWIHSPNRDGSKATLKTTRSARDDTKVRTRPVAPSLGWDPQSRHSRPGACQGLTFNAAGMIVIEADFRGVFRMGPYRRLGSGDRNRQAHAESDQSGRLQWQWGHCWARFYIEDAQTTVAVIRTELELEGKIHGFSDLSRSRNCSAIQSMNTRRRGDSWRVWE